MLGTLTCMCSSGDYSCLAEGWTAASPTPAEPGKRFYTVNEPAHSSAMRLWNVGNMIGDLCRAAQALTPVATVFVFFLKKLFTLK